MNQIDLLTPPIVNCDCYRISRLLQADEELPDHLCSESIRASLARWVLASGTAHLLGVPTPIRLTEDRMTVPTFPDHCDWPLRVHGPAAPYQLLGAIEQVVPVPPLAGKEQDALDRLLRHVPDPGYWNDLLPQMIAGLLCAGSEPPWDRIREFLVIRRAPSDRESVKAVWALAVRHNVRMKVSSLLLGPADFGRGNQELLGVGEVLTQVTGVSSWATDANWRLAAKVASSHAVWWRQVAGEKDFSRLPDIRLTKLNQREPKQDHLTPIIEAYLQGRMDWDTLEDEVIEAECKALRKMSLTKVQKGRLIKRVRSRAEQKE
jgi:hypothetical protein